MWRPKGWRNIWKEDMPTFSLDTPESIKAAEENWMIRAEQFEAGADAMLEALKQKGSYFAKGQAFDGFEFHKTNTGWLVFIPSDEDKS